MVPTTSRSRLPFKGAFIRIFGSMPLLAWLFIAWAALSIVFIAYISTTERPASDEERFSMEDQYDGYSSAFSANEEGFVNNKGEQCNVVGINLHGGLSTYVPSWWQDDQSISADERNITSSEYITSIIDEASSDRNIDAVLIDVDSPGGSPVAGEEIASSIKHAGKPVVALIRGIGASAAYWAVSPAWPIFASKNSDVGSIGVTASFVEKIDKDSKFIQLSTGKYKDTLNPDKPITDEERELIMRDVGIIHENFIESVAVNRKLSEEAVRDLADGSTVLGEQAKELGLVDRIGDYYDAMEYLKASGAIRWGKEPTICWY